MKDKKMTRKQFLAGVLSGLGAVLLNRFAGLPRLFEPKPRAKHKEAKFYRRADHLAG